MDYVVDLRLPEEIRDPHIDLIIVKVMLGDRQLKNIYLKKKGAKILDLELENE